MPQLPARLAAFDEQQHTGAVLPAGQELGEMVWHCVVIVTYQHTLRVRSARQHLWIRDTCKLRRVRRLNIKQRLAAQRALDNQGIEVGVGLKAHPLTHRSL
jgi:hypothetical protein